MDIEELLSRVALAFGIGLLIGLERGWHKRKARPGSRSAGVRTFAISGLLGGIVGAIAQGSDNGLGTGGAILLGTAFMAYAAVITTFGLDENRAAKTFSATTTIAALLTFMLGAYALIGDVRIAAACAVAAAGILMVRETLHAWVAKITLVELESGLVLLAMTFIALPIVPDRAMGPFGGVNPRQVWLIAIVLAAVSFAGYIAVKLLGERRGVLMAAATGGLISSTAVTLANARRAAAGEGSPRLLAAGAALATAVSFVRVAVIVAVLKAPLVPLIAPSLLVGAIVAAGFAIVATYWRSAQNDEQNAVQFRNPFRFWSVVGMAVLMGALIVIGGLIYQTFGAIGAITGAAAMGLFDVDAMTVSMTRLVPRPLDLHGAAFAILAGVASNVLGKVAIGALVGRGWFALATAVVSVASILAGWLTLLMTLTLIGS
jgi:uncharacterized membrane protein (DUF4010 family)